MQKRWDAKAEKSPGKVRREKATMKEQLTTLLALPVADDDKVKYLKSLGYTSDEIDNQLLLTHSIFEKAVNGDINAYKVIVGLIQNEDIERKSKTIDELDELFRF